MNIFHFFSILTMMFFGQIILSVINPFHLLPNFLLLVPVMLGLKKGAGWGLLAGISCGFLVDIFSGETMGTGIVLYTAFGGISGVLQKKLFSENILVPLSIIFLFSLIHGGSFYLAKTNASITNFNNNDFLILKESILNVLFYPIILIVTKKWLP